MAAMSSRVRLTITGIDFVVRTRDGRHDDVQLNFARGYKLSRLVPAGGDDKFDFSIAIMPTGSKANGQAIVRRYVL
jgi:hypothetical protein